MRIRGALLAAALILAVGAGYAFAFTPPNDFFEGFPIVLVKVNDVLMQSDVPAINFHGRTMVPVRFVSEALGATVSWDDATWTASVRLASTADLERQLAESNRRIAELEAEIVRLTPPEPPPSTSNSRTNPAGLNEPVRIQVSDLFAGTVALEMELLELVSGQKAWAMVQGWNMFNSAPGAGREYILAKIRVKVLAADKEPYEINHAQFGAYSATGVEYTGFFSVAGIDPNLAAKLYPGAEHIGYTTFIVNTADSPVGVYMHRWGENAIWFDLRSH